MVDNVGAERIDLDELARLEEERDFLLASISDLDREHDVGDVDDTDYQELRDGYVGRAAEAIRAIEADQAALASTRSSQPRRRGRTVAWVGGALVFTVVAGVLMANALGSRGVDDQITGKGAMPTSSTEECRTLSFQEPEKGIECYAKVLAADPDDVDALTYQGWAKVRSGDAAGGTALFDRVVELDPNYADVHVFRASVLKNAGDFAGAEAELDTLYSLNPSPLTISTLQQMGLDTEVAVGLLAPDVAACWTKEEAALTAATTATKENLEAVVADLLLAVTCHQQVLAQRPDEVDSLVLKALAEGILDEQSIESGVAGLNRALELEPGNADALLLRAALLLQVGRTDDAVADLDALGERRISPLLAMLDKTQLRAAAEAAAADERSSGSAAPTTTTATQGPNG